MENEITNIRVNKTSSYGRFEITGKVNGMDVKTFTTDSIHYNNRNGDYCDTDEQLAAHEEAMAYFRHRLNEAYEYLTNN